MPNRKKQTFVTRFFSSKLFLFVGFFVILILALNFVRGYYQKYKVDQEILQLKEEISLLERKKIESMEILEYVSSEAFVEEKARTELNMKKEGEKVIYIKQGSVVEKKSNQKKEAYNTIGQNVSNPVKWWYYFTQNTL
ncbi:MAG: hypothetical protein CL685_04235 [Candidatus Magasanikbacteria bacterium]|nr:hypothetical protein [Candidatus Magasanikbacteria bacterium]|tara:strand:+ start:6265 stop:6678 length:414 start_codon:yes stop_codon:yes gene_type:complete